MRRLNLEVPAVCNIYIYFFFSSANCFVAVCYCLALEGLHWPDWKPIWTGSQWYPRRPCGEGLVASPVNEGQLGLHRKPMRGRCLCVHCVLVRRYGQWKIFTYLHTVDASWVHDRATRRADALNALVWARRAIIYLFNRGFVTSLVSSVCHIWVFIALLS